MIVDKNIAEINVNKEMSKMPRKLIYELYVEIILLKACNFKCVYCFHNSVRSKMKRFIVDNIFQYRTLSDMKIKTLANKITSLGKKTRVGLSGGEPFLFPGFIELCKELTKECDIYLATNLSSEDVYRFADEINPKRVYLFCISLHILQLEEKGLVQDFIKKFNYITKKGFNTKVIYVMYPAVIGRFKEDYDYFASHGIDILVKPFIGMYKGKEYPEAYTESELALIKGYRSNSDDIEARRAKANNEKLEITEDIEMTGIIKAEGKEANQNMNFKGRMCKAGQVSIVIDSDGTFFRCFGDNKPIGNIFEEDLTIFNEPKVCKAKRCECVSEGEIYRIPE